MIRAGRSPNVEEPAAGGRADLDRVAHPSSGRDGPARPVWLAHVGPVPVDLHVPVDPPQEEELTGEIAIATRAVGLNLADLLIASGAMADPPESPGAIRLELSGLVTRAGGGFQVGDPVMGVTDHAAAPFMGVGDHAAGIEQLVAPADRFVRLPAGWSFEQGAAFPVSYLEAYELLRGRVQRGTRLLVHGAASPVGQATVQLARALGCELIGAPASGRDVDLVIDLREEATGVGGLDHLLADPVRLRQRFGEILALSGVVPAVGALFPVEEVREAVAFLESGPRLEKVVLAVDPP